VCELEVRFTHLWFDLARFFDWWQINCKAEMLVFVFWKEKADHADLSSFWGAHPLLGAGDRAPRSTNFSSKQTEPDKPVVAGMRPTLRRHMLSREKACCDCTRKLEERLAMKGVSFLQALRKRKGDREVASAD
jgi:hypothetical protein